LADFSGYIAADELYDGPFCILSIVDNRQHKRIIYEVLDHTPTHQDIRRFFGRFKKILKARQLTLTGITTDAWGQPLRRFTPFPLPRFLVVFRMHHLTRYVSSTPSPR